MWTAQLKEQLSLPALSGGLVPVSVNGQTNTGTINMALFARAMFIVSAGLGVATGNIKLQGSNFSNGASAVDVSGASIAYSANASVYTLECRSEQMPSLTQFLKCNIISDGAVLMSAVGIGAEPRFQSAAGYDNSAVPSRVASNA